MYKDWLARNRNIVSKWNDMSTVPMECCFGQLALKKSPTLRVGLVQIEHHHHHLIKM
jgi:hypothetical protein